MTQPSQRNPNLRPPCGRGVTFPRRLADNALRKENAPFLGRKSGGTGAFCAYEKQSKYGLEYTFKKTILSTSQSAAPPCGEARLWLAFPNRWAQSRPPMRGARYSALKAVQGDPKPSPHAGARSRMGFRSTPGRGVRARHDCAAKISVLGERFGISRTSASAASGSVLCFPVRF